MSDLKGVQFLTPPASIIADALRMVEAGMAHLEPHDRGGIVTVVTQTADGKTHVNAAIVSRVGRGAELVGWIGKTWGEQVTGGGAVKIRW